MRIKINLRFSIKLRLPAGYNNLIQAFIYNHLGEKSDWLHEEGFKHDNRKFKLFCYSGILEYGKFCHAEKLFVFPEAVSFYLSSPVDWIIQNIAAHTLLEKQSHLGRNIGMIESIEVRKSTPPRSNSIRCRTLSPIENHSTFMTAGNKKKTYYYSPFETEFSELTNSNLQKKWQSLHNEECPYTIKIEPKFNSHKRESIINYGSGDNKTVVKAWHGHFQLTGDPEFLQFALDAGLGGRNSQGFGMVDVLEEKEE
ncbi:MAG: CRISPR-associated endoribonuclease Cas6 [Candidatus Marinimicrobia bacterium]|nr:CRISPR-associated endoribonuclease Cas6 [Candidatus Neomarinimicrobiota bacterium]